MEKIYSKLKPETLLHLVNRRSDFNGRTNIAPESEFLQLASLQLKKGQTFKAHKHIFCEKKTYIAQESWMVLEGRVECIFYDLDDKVLARKTLGPGDCSMTFRGGHNYIALDENTLVYEYKTGPYLGIENDKTFI